MAVQRSNPYNRRTAAGSRNLRERAEYIEGNTVRQLNAQPKRREHVSPEKRVKQHPQKMPASMVGINGASFLFLATVLCTVLFIVFTYIHTQNQLREMKGQIVTIQSEIADLQELNDARYRDVEASVDLSEVYEKATKKLKMVPAENNQIYTYRSRKSDMVRQYADIPGAEK